MNDTRRKIVFLVLFIFSGIIIFYLFERMILHKDEYMHARYVDSKFINLMESLIAENIFLVDGNRVVIDEQALRAKKLPDKTERRVRKSLPLLYTGNGGIRFDNQSVSIVNSRILREDGVIRGKFFDRHGIVLADNIMNRNTKGYKRIYIFGPEFYPIIGHSNPVFGKRNLEKIMDDHLTGKLHWPVYASSAEPFRRLKLGDNIVLTIDSRIQQSAYELMKDKKGSVVVLDVKTGEILAAVSTPSFDPNTQDRGIWREAFQDTKERPYENRAFSTLYPPGSTFKTVVASAWLESEAKIDDYQVNCTGRKNKYNISDIHVHGKENFTDAYADSCNVFFSEIGVRLGYDLLDYSQKFGFNREIELLPQMKNHSYTTTASFAFLWKNRIEGKDDTKILSPIDFIRNPKLIAQGSIGQNLVSATPVQMAIIASTIANKGVMLNPYIIKEIRKPINMDVFI